MDIQAMMNAMMAATKDERSRYHLTLGGLIEALEAAPAKAVVTFSDGQRPREMCSYRGYYSDLAISCGSKPMTAKGLLSIARAALNAEFTGYKGGEFMMMEETPLWRSEYGHDSGEAIISADVMQGGVVLHTKLVD